MIAKRRHPTFPREYSQFKWRIARRGAWRRPRGKDSKQRRGLESKGAWPTVGYSQPREIRGLHPLGLKDVLVHNPQELDGIDPKTSAARIAGAVGSLKRAAIVKKAEGLKIRVLNPFFKKKLKKEAKKEEAKKGVAVPKEEKKEVPVPKEHEAEAKEAAAPKAEEKKAAAPKTGEERAASVPVARSNGKPEAGKEAEKKVAVPKAEKKAEAKHAASKPKK